jgi:hypothetical protein
MRPVYSLLALASILFVLVPTAKALPTPNELLPSWPPIKQQPDKFPVMLPGCENSILGQRTACEILSRLFCFPTGGPNWLPCDVMPSPPGEIAVGCGLANLPVNDPPYPPILINGTVNFGPYNGVGVNCP